MRLQIEEKKDLEEVRCGGEIRKDFHDGSATTGEVFGEVRAERCGDGEEGFGENAETGAGRKRDGVR
ncbi:MAG: hypothetical protein WBQ59_11420, partial [Candidatus Acidiferrum sp.]